MSGHGYSGSRLLKEKATFLLIDYHPHMLLCGKGTSFPDPEGNLVAIRNYVHLLRDHTSIAKELGFQYVAFEESLITHSATYRIEACSGRWQLRDLPWKTHGTREG